MDVVIVGAGVPEGRRVHVIERDLSEPDRIVGELLQPGGYLKLIELGLEGKQLLKITANESIDAQKVFGYALYKNGNDTKLSYRLKNYASDIVRRSFHNGRFIHKMHERGATHKNVTLEQGTVTALIEEKGTIKGVTYKNKAGEEMRSYVPLTIVCDGCFSYLRRNLCSPKVDNPSCFVGLILENCDLPYANHGHAILGEPSPILFYPISSTEVRCLVDVPGTKWRLTKGNIRTMQNKSMPATPVPTPGAILLGDALNMRHPLTGGGMTVALSDIVLLRDLLRSLSDLNDAPALCEYLESFYTLRKPVSSTINTLAGALYKHSRLFSQQLFFKAQQYQTSPISLLSGLNPRPVHLFLHFFAVAVYGVGRLMIPFPTPKGIWLGTRLILGASGIIFPIIKDEGVRQMCFPATIPAYYKALPLQMKNREQADKFQSYSF
ncbi:hypothetical protein DVH24_034461 [Malus domestica]|uniref:Squalene monooxygenase n=1 Tax=Malus domestica TaxID=3750 RepID=A0A498J2A5_MALDO|nr:hypothetical protein DVH24_034461 [Malus domestica]